ncbi:MAG: hypothetical protein JRJ87_20025 [Deltaproteobacteria bacterium]|nr:hypothetical protein [Deltaproteobacteria bacterium]
MLRAFPRIFLYILIFIAVIYIIRFLRKVTTDRQKAAEKKNPKRPGDDAINVTYKVTDAKILKPCPVCQDLVKGASHICPVCDAVHHAECWKLNDGCGACKTS